jgi:hypothetical protein
MIHLSGKEGKKKRASALVTRMSEKRSYSSTDSLLDVLSGSDEVFDVDRSIRSEGVGEDMLN